MQSHEDPTARTDSADLDPPPVAKPLGERDLSTIVERIYEYVWLSHDSTMPDVAERVVALRQQLAAPTEEVREFWRASAYGLAELDHQVGRLTDIGGGGLSVTMATPIKRGAETHVRVTDDDAGWVYEFPCVVVWSTPDPDARAGLRFAGKPRRARVD